MRRGFGNVVFCATQERFELLEAKLKRGFPHYLIEIPTKQIDHCKYLLCRYNIAKSRVARDSKRKPVLDAKCERYASGLSLPVAIDDEEKFAMLRKWARHTVVLIEGEISLELGVRVIAFSEEDEAMLMSIKKQTGSDLQIDRSDRPYRRCPKYVSQIGRFIESAIEEPDWRGSGLNYDNLLKEIWFA